MSNFQMPYENIDEIRMRLDKTVVRFGGRPVLITGIVSSRRAGVFKVAYHTYPHLEELTAVYPDPGWDLRPFEPIYTHFGENWDGRAYWLARTVERQYRQGGYNQNTFYTILRKENHEGTGVGGSSLVKAYTLSMKTTKLKDFREETPGWMRGDFTSFALSESVAVCWDPEKATEQVYYRDRYLGDIIKHDPFPILKTDNESLSLNPWCSNALTAVGIYTE